MWLSLVLAVPVVCAQGLATEEAGQDPFATDAAQGPALAALYERNVTWRRVLPEGDVLRYARLLDHTLHAHALGALASQYFVMVDRHPKVQTVMVWWKSSDGTFHFIGASPCSTGRPGEFEHFATPLGVFEHGLGSLDFRAEGTLNKFGIRGYGVKGMRVYDFGWVDADRGWGSPGRSAMRLQMHSTDPDVLEPRLGIPRSKGCIRIPASLNEFIDRHGLLDAAYEAARWSGRTFWVLRRDRTPTLWPGRYLVVVESEGS